MSPTRAGLAPLLAALLLLPTLLLRSSWPPDETRYADVARAVLHEGWVVPRLHGEPYTEKPPVAFWAAAAVAALGVPIELAPRVVSVVSGVALVVLVPALAGAAGLPADVAARAALVLATTPLFLVHAQLGMLDAFFALLLAAAVLAKLRRASSRRPALWTLAEGALLGLALLTKGPVALLFPAGLRVGAALTRRGPGRFDASDLAVLALALGIGGAWLAAAAAEAGTQYAHGLVFGQIASRVGGEVPHAAPPGELFAVGFAWLLPWSALGLVALAPRVRRVLPAGLAPFLGWLAVPWVVLALLPSQQVQYLLPALPAGAVLVGSLPAEAAGRLVPRALAALACVLGVALLAFAAAAGALLGEQFRPEVRALLVGDAWLRVGLAGIGAGLLWVAATPSGVARSITARCGTGGALAFAAAVLVTWRADASLSGAPLFAEPVLAQAPRVLAPSSLRSAVRLRAHRADVGALKDEELLAEALRDPDLVAVVREKRRERIEGDQPGSFEVLARGFVMGEPHLVLRLRRERAATVESAS